MSHDDTPTHNYHRRRTDEMGSDELTHHRLKNLEQGVADIMDNISAARGELSVITTRLAVGAHQMEGTEKRLESLEKSRMWVVLGVLAAFGSFVWTAITQLFSGPKVPVVLACVLLMGCAADRAQIGADARAGIEGAQLALDVGQVETAKAILEAVDARLPATAEVSSAEWPAPKMTADQVFADPEAYGKSAPPEPSQVGFWACVGGGILATLGFLRVAAPFVPGLGPLWKSSIDVAYAIAQHSRAKQVDAAAERAKAVVDQVAPTLALLRSAAPAVWTSLPDSAQQAMSALIDSGSSHPPNAS